MITTTTSASVLSITPSVTTTTSTSTEKSDKPKQAEIVEIKSEHASPQKSKEATSPTSTTAPMHNSDSLPSISRPVTAPWRIESALSCSAEGKESPRGGEFDYNYGSPDSPLSKMDLITLGSPVEIDNICTRESCNGNVTQLEMPPPERLLPVGPCQDVISITDRLHRALTNDCCSSKYTKNFRHIAICNFFSISLKIHKTRKKNIQQATPKGNRNRLLPRTKPQSKTALINLI